MLSLKVANNFTSLIPVVGNGLSNIVGGKIDKAEQAKANRVSEQEQRSYQAAYESELSKTKGGYVDAMELSAKGVPNWKDYMSAGIGGAMTGIGGILGGTKEVGQVGATVIDSSITEWLKSHVKHILFGFTGLLTLVLTVKMLRPKKRGRY